MITSEQSCVSTSFHSAVVAKKTDILHFATILSFAALAYFAQAWLRINIVDDAFIYVRVASNLIHHGEWSFNLGERVNPCTGPLYTIIVAALLQCGASAEHALLWTFAGGLFICATLSYLALKPYGQCIALSAGWSIFVFTTLLRSTGMESVWFLSALLLSALLFDKGRPILLGITIGATCLLRPEGIFLAALIIIITIGQEKKIPGKMLLSILLSCAPWIIFSWHTFGTILSQSFKIKSIQGSIGWWGKQPPYFEYFFSLARYPGITFGLALLGLFFVLGRWKKSTWFEIIVILFALIQVSIFSFQHAPPSYFWYNIPGYYSVNILLLRLCAELIQLLSQYYSSWTARRIDPKRITFVSLFGAGIVSAFLYFFGPEPMTSLSSTFRCGPAYKKTGEWIAKNSPSSAHIAMGEIGYLGYFSERAIVDIHGLIHPDAFDLIRSEIPDWWITRKVPDYIVVHDPVWPNEPTTIDWPESTWKIFQEQYESVFSVDGEFPLCKAIVVYRRKSQML